MRSFLISICILLLAASFVAAQTATTTKASPAKPAERASDKSDPAANLPSEATVDSFLQQSVGYQPDSDLENREHPSGRVGGLAEVTVVLANQQGRQQLSKFYVTPDGTHALTGEIIPFGAKPFDPAKKTLEKGITGPERGPKDAPVMIVEFGDLQCPACKAAQPTIEALVAAEPNARFVFQNFPLEMHNWAAKGAAYGADCVGRASS